ncbi:MAG: RnfABCDGE type electron transport complex subunit D [Clostridiales bacterium]|nr:RnfABCDGE type electron transport complex subunit D [Clostridiales bacterium]
MKSVTEKKQNKNSYADFLIMSAVPLIMAWYYNGVQVFKLLLFSVISAVLCETAMSLILKVKLRLGDLNAVYIGVLIALMLPANASGFLAAAGSAFAVVVAKMPFGGSQNTPFVPAAAGFAFLCLCKPEEVFSYPPILTSAVGQSTSLASMLTHGNSIRLNSINFINLMTGEFVGPMGATCTVILLCTLIYLLIRRPYSVVNSLGFLLSCGIMAVLFPRVHSGALCSLVMELCSGMLIFAALFLITDPCASPHRPLNRLIYGLVAGVICMLMRYFGKFEESACFAVIITNAIWPVFERFLNDTPYEKPEVPVALKKEKTEVTGNG